LRQQPFKMLLVQSCQNTYSMYEGWLREVDLFKTFKSDDLVKLSDLLETKSYDTGEVVISQGEVGDRFYILEEGECAAFISGPSGEKQVKTYVTQGDYFGELALLNDEPRKATVRAIGTGCMLASMSRDDFLNIMGPIKDTLQRRASEYNKIAESA